MGFNPGNGGALSGATDVAFNSPQDEQVLAFNQNSTKWTNKDALDEEGVANLINTDSEAREAIQGTMMRSVIVFTGSELRPETSEIVVWIGGTTKPTNMLAGDLWFDSSMTGGTPSVPAVPDSLNVSADTTSAVLTWAKPHNGGSEITDYVVQYKLTSSDTWTTFNDGTSTSTTETITSLTAGTSYDFRVAAVNAEGQSDFSAVTSKSTTSTATGASLSETFEGGTSGAAITTSNTNFSSTDGSPTFGAGALVGSLSMISPAGGVGYGEFTMASTSTVYWRGYVWFQDASAAGGGGTWIARVVNTSGTVVATLRLEYNSALRLVQGTSGPGGGGPNLHVTSTLPAEQWARVEWRVDATTQRVRVFTGENVHGSIPDHDSGFIPYTGSGPFDTVGMGKISISAGTIVHMDDVAIGSDWLGSSVEPGPATAPSAPSSLSTSPGTTSMGLSWSAPYNGGSAITDYAVQYKLASSSTWSTFNDGTSTTTAATITSLTAGSSYDFRVAAINSVGQSSYSAVATRSTLSSEPTGTILWQDGFDAAPNGQLSKSTGDAAFGPTVASTSSSTFQYGQIVDSGGGNKYLRHRIPAGGLGPLICTPKLSRATTHAVLEYEVFFESGFQWRWGGKIGAGFVGVAPGVGIYEPTSGNGNRDVGFSTRIMWHGRGNSGTRPFQSALGPIPSGDDNQLVTYIYARYPKDGFSGYGWHTSLDELTGGVWHTVRMEVKLNTVGQNNGVFKVWIDGQQKFAASNWNYRMRNDILIQAVLYDTHRGGGTSPSDWVSSTTDYVRTRNIVVTDLE